MMWATLKQHIGEWRGVFSVAPTIAGIAIASDAVAAVKCALAIAEQRDILNQLGYVRLKGRERGTVVYQVLRSPTVNENPESSISVNVAITLAEQRSLSRNLRSDSFSTTDYHPSSLTEF